MYGIIGTAIFVECYWYLFNQEKEVKDIKGLLSKLWIKIVFFRYIVGGTMFGLGWGIVGCCPGPIFILLGTGMQSIAIILFGALLGTYVYGMIKDKLPH